MIRPLSYSNVLSRASFPDQTSDETYLCKTCTDSLILAYSFWEQIKAAEKRLTIPPAKEERKELFEEDDDCKREDELDTGEKYELFEVFSEDGITEYTLVKNAKDIPEEDVIDYSDLNVIIPKLKTTSNKKALESPQQSLTAKTLESSRPPQNLLEEENASEIDNIILSDDDDPDSSIATLPAKRPRTKLSSSTDDRAVNDIQPSHFHEISDECAATMDLAAASPSIHTTDPSSVYKCKHCPKAFAALYHLMVHTRKS